MQKKVYCYQQSMIGYFLEVELEYPDELHKLHNVYPLAPEKLSVSGDICQIIVKKMADKWVWDKNWWCKKINSKFRQQN